MAQPQPIYTPQNCKAAYQLNWSLSVFWNDAPPAEADWLAPLRNATEPDGVHLLEHRLTQKDASQLLLSTRPETAPPAAVRSVKGRLQYLVKAKLPKAFRRNYGLWSVGTVNWQVIQRYIAAQPRHHPMADPRVQSRFESLSIDGDGDALDHPRLRGCE